MTVPAIADDRERALAVLEATIELWGAPITGPIDDASLGERLRDDARARLHRRLGAGRRDDRTTTSVMTVS